MRWILYLAGGLAVLLAVMAIVGARLPRSHVASRALKVRRPPQDVWTAITQATGKSSVPVDVIENDPPRRLVTRVKETEKMFGGTWTIVVTPEPDGSTLQITEDGWVANPIFRFMSRYVIGHHATMDGILKDVAKQFGEEPILRGV